MLGNLLGHIDALLSDNLEDTLSQSKINYMSETVEVKDERLNDKRKGIYYTLYQLSYFFRSCNGKNY